MIEKIQYTIVIPDKLLIIEITNELVASEEEEPKDVDIPDYFDVNYLEMSDGAKLRYLSYRPKEPEGHVLMYPGMNTLILSWIRVLELLYEENYAIDYVESREKHTSILPKESMISRERMLDDCVETVKLLGLQGTDYITIGSSLGSTTLIHCMADQDIHPKYALLVGPSAHFTFPFAVRMFLPFVNHLTYRLFGKAVMKKIALRKYTNEDADPKQAKKYALALELANPVKLKTCLQAWRGNKVNGELSKIDGDKTTCYLIGASEDILHPDTVTREIAEGIDQSEFVDLKTNTAAHDRPLVDLILELE